MTKKCGRLLGESRPALDISIAYKAVKLSPRFFHSEERAVSPPAPIPHVPRRAHSVRRYVDRANVARKLRLAFSLDWYSSNSAMISRIITMWMPSRSAPYGESDFMGQQPTAPRQGALARGPCEADVNRTYLSKIEKSATYVGLEIIGKLAAALEFEPAELLRLPPRRARH